jgi:hypothetical protein
MAPQLAGVTYTRRRGPFLSPRCWSGAVLGLCLGFVVALGHTVAEGNTISQAVGQLRPETIMQNKLNELQNQEKAKKDFQDFQYGPRAETRSSGGAAAPSTLMMRDEEIDDVLF